MSQLDDKLTANDLDAMVHEVDAQGLGRVDVEGIVDYSYYCTYERERILIINQSNYWFCKMLMMHYYRIRRIDDELIDDFTPDELTILKCSK